MATAASQVSRPHIATGTYDRLFYSSIAVAMALTVFAGFAPTYYLRTIFGRTTITGATTLSPLAHLHGAIFTAWVLLFIIQTALVATHRVAVHRQLGVFGTVLAALMTVIGPLTAIKSAARGAAPPGIDPLAFLAIPLSDIFTFAAFVTAAVWLRRKKEAHKRLMLLAYISIIAAAVARIPGVFPLGPFGFYRISFLFLLAAVIYDLFSRRRVHPAYVWGGGLLVLSVPLRLMLSATPAWRTFAEFLVQS